MAVADRLKTALDESRLLILGVQVLFGFQFEAVFQDLFADVPAISRYVHCAGLILLLVSLGLLIAPSLFHQLIYGGDSTPEGVQMATAFAGASLLPLTLGLGATIFFLVLFLVIVITNFSVRGLASGMVIMGVVLVTVLLAYFGWWDEVFSWFGRLEIHLNLGAYF